MVEKTIKQIQEPWLINIFCDLQNIINNFRQYNIGTKITPWSQNLILCDLAYNLIT